jgi:hypothetical protein
MNSASKRPKGGREAEPKLQRWVKLRATIALALTLAAFETPSAAASPCAPWIPEVAADLERTGLPTSESRWRAVERLWTESASEVNEDVKKSLQTGSISSVADIIQGRTQDLLREAIVADRTALVSEFLKLWTLPIDALKWHRDVLVYYLTPQDRLSKVTLARPHEMWIDRDGIENVLYSAIYLAGAMDIVATIARKSPDVRSAQMTEFARRVSGVAADHYRRWAFGPPGIWQVRGWGCDGSDIDLIEFTRRRLERSFAKSGIAYCDSPTSADILIMIGVANLLRTATLAPELASLSERERQDFADLLHLQAQFAASKLVFGSVVDDDRRAMPTLDFDPGSWARHPDYAFAADESMTFPDRRALPKEGVGWDFSHGARLAWMMLTLASSEDMLSSGIDWTAATDAFARQIAYRVLDGSAVVPRFTNFLDGSNGWYRAAESSGTGYAPFGLTRAYLAMPWARLSLRNPRLMVAAKQVWEALAAPSPRQCELFRRFYIENTHWQDRHPVAAPLVGAWANLDLLTFLAVAPVERY